MAKPPVVQGKTKPRIYIESLPENCDENGELIHCAPGTGCHIPEDERGDEWQCICRTHGYQAIEFAIKCLHLALFPWQKWLLIHALELIPDENGNDVYRFRTVIVCAARQNGKTVVEVVLALWHIYVRHSRTVIGTAQDLANAERAWRDALALAESDDELSDLMEAPFMGHPKSLMLVDGCEYRVSSTTGDAGRGFSGDLILLDELRTHKNWASWSAVTNTMNARPRAQAWAFSNAGDASSVVLRYQRAVAHRSLGYPDGEREFEGVLDEVDDELSELLEAAGGLQTGWYEWSAPPDAKRGELDALSQANPSMNHPEVSIECPTTRTLLAAIGGSPAYEAETEVMCRWATMGVGGPFPEGSWLETVNPKARPAADSKKVVCVEISSRRSQTYIARAGLKEDGTVVVGIRYDHPGTDWIAESLIDDKDSTEAVVIRTDTGGSTLSALEELKRKLIGFRILEWKAGDINAAHGQMFDRLRDRTIEHLPHGGLDMAATSADSVVKPGGGFVVNINTSPTDVAPLYAAIGAVWGLEQMTAARYNVLESVV
jgi:hypothetical protein